jgi:C4-type Zn-finger protein
MSDFSDAYVTFFGSPAGEAFLTTIYGMIDTEHEAAEKNPELARDHTQRAKGIREVTNIIKSMTAKDKPI